MAIRTAERSGSLLRPVVRALPPELTPLRALALVERAPHTVFFESGGAYGEDARWTILAFDPVWHLDLRDSVLLRTGGGIVETIPGPPLEALAQAWPPRAEMAWEDDPVVVSKDTRSIPFVSGLAGYLSYDLKDCMERYPRRARRDSSLADLWLGFYDVVWTWDRASGRGWVVATGLPERDARERAIRSESRLREQWERLARAGSSSRGDAFDSGASPFDAARSDPFEPGGRDAARLESNFTPDGYRRAVERALDHIAAGDIYQVNLAQRFHVEPAPDPASLYRRLRAESPAPFAAYLSFVGGGIVSSSPERFFRVEGRRIETWPIKGTRPRATDPREDAEWAARLRASEKDRAENVMIVDLERNDLGRICEIGSIRVPALCEVASYANVHHLVSRVEGRLREDSGPVEILRAMFPGGSITGAPKIRAVEIIDALEPTRRGVYTGAIGYWDVTGACDWNVAIRTIVVESGVASFHAGGGIVADSTPDGEYEETLTKASAMLRALAVTGPPTSARVAP